MNLTKEAKEIIRTLEENNFYVEYPSCGEPAQRSIEKVVERENDEWQTMRVHEDGKIKVESKLNNCQLVAFLI